MTVFDGSESSFYRIVDMLPLNQQLNFINDFELLSIALGGEHKLIGFKAEDITKEAYKLKKWIIKQNIIFLESFINELKNSNINSTYLHINEYGEISKPKEGFLYKKRYTVSDLDILLNNQKDKYSSSLE